LKINSDKEERFVVSSIRYK